MKLKFLTAISVGLLLIGIVSAANVLNLKLSGDATGMVDIRDTQSRFGPHNVFINIKI